MSTIRDDVARLWPETLAIPSGVTCEVKPVDGQVGIILKYVSGGSLSILATSKNSVGQSFLRATTGCSFALGNSLGTQYTLATSEIMNINMCDSLFLFATGATNVCSILRLRSVGDW